MNQNMEEKNIDELLDEVHSLLDEIGEIEDVEDYGDDLQGLIGTTMHLVLDDETETDAIIIAAFALEAYPSWSYIALLPLVEEEEDQEETDVLLYRLEVDEEGSPMLALLETEEEYALAAEAFNQEMEALSEEEEEC
ncbi:MAG: DUF1292 domain-containing protein [Eubacteriales bacterium]|nr:DUF1292 domain-containing protein [Eubacteriales bacterium]